MLLRQASLLPHVSSFHDVPVALIIEPDLLDVLMLEGGEESFTWPADTPRRLARRRWLRSKCFFQ